MPAGFGGDAPFVVSRDSRPPMPDPRRPASNRPRTSQGRPRARVNPGRLAALQALVAVDRGEHAEEALARVTPSGLAPQDRGLAWHLVLGVLRHRSALDEVIRLVAQRGASTLDAPVAASVRVGLFELRFGGVPPHAAVDQAVEGARALGAAHASGFVNAILRRQVGVEVGPDALLGHPLWLVARWRERHGSEAADAWMRANNEPAPVYLVAKEDPAGVAREFQHRGMALVPVLGAEGAHPLRNASPETVASVEPDGATTLPDVVGIFRAPEGAGSPDTWPGYETGRWWIMDPAAVAVADLCGEVDGLEVIDTCAAPGGKSFRLASRGARVVATDSDAKRLARLEAGAARLGLPVVARQHDWAAGPSEDLRAPVVLVDAPCSGLGVVRRHPDIRWRRTEADLFGYAERQRAILANAAKSVLPGGVLVYAVCSPEPEEGEAVAASLGWPSEARFCNAPALDGGDVFQAFRLRRPAE